MANVQPGDIMTYTISGTCFGQRWMNTFHYRARLAPSLPVQEAAFDAFNSQMIATTGLESRLRNCLSQDVTIDQRWFQIVKPARFAKYTIGGAVAGLVDASQRTVNLQAAITRRGEFGNRKNVGGIRVILPTGDDVISEGLIQPGTQAVLELLAQSMELTVVTTGAVVTWDPLVSNPATAAAYIELKQAFVQPTVRVIRRRTVGLGI